MTWEPDYVDVADLADFARVAADNPYVGTYGTAASRAVDGFCNRQFGQLAAPATFTYRSPAVRMRDGRWLVQIDDLMTTVGLVVVVNGVTTSEGTDGYRLWPDNAIAKGRPATAITLDACPDGDVDVTAQFGWAAYPAAVTGATWLQVNRWMARRESPYGIAGSPSEGSEVRLSALLDPDARTMLAAANLVRARMPR